MKAPQISSVFMVLRHEPIRSDNHYLAPREGYSSAQELRSFLFLQVLHHIDEKDGIDRAGQKKREGLAPAAVEDDIVAVVSGRYRLL